jgi:hypothetical protein
MPPEPFWGLGLRGSRTPADPGSRKSEPEMTTLPSSRSRSTSSWRRASIWACKTRRSSETTSSLLVSSCKRDVNSSRASECGSGKAATRPILLRDPDYGKSTERGTLRSAVSPARAQFCIHEPAVTTAMAWACLRTSPSAAPGPRAAAGPRRPRRRLRRTVVVTVRRRTGGGSQGVSQGSGRGRRCVGDATGQLSASFGVTCWVRSDRAAARTHRGHGLCPGREARSPCR